MFKPVLNVELKRKPKPRTDDEIVDERDWEEILNTSNTVIKEQTTHLAQIGIAVYAAKVAIDTIGQLALKHL